jgi:glycosyltransferase involved in cell wall biosynthesis
MIKASVILCTYNPRIDILNKTVDALRNQTLDKNEWELILVDNNSSNNFQQNLDLSWHPKSIIISETNQGLTPARIAGINRAKAPLLVFVDDDNFLDKDYLVNAIKIGDSYPFLGAWGGTSLGKFEVTPPSWFSEKHFGMLAIRKFERDLWSNKYFDLETNPIGAGLVIRKDVGEAYVESQQKENGALVLDRNGSDLLSGGDNEIVFKAIDLGYGTGNFTGLVLTHYIPAGRLTAEYMVRLTESMAISNVLLFYKYGREYSLPVRARGLATDVLYQLQLLRMPKIKKAMMDAEVRGILKGKEILKSLNA